MFGRWIEPLWKRKFTTPYVHLVFGARQTGKSTLLRKLLPDAAQNVPAIFDAVQHPLRFRQAPVAFCAVRQFGPQTASDGCEPADGPQSSASSISAAAGGAAAGPGRKGALGHAVAAADTHARHCGRAAVCRRRPVRAVDVRRAAGRSDFRPCSSGQSTPRPATRGICLRFWTNTRNAPGMAMSFAAALSRWRSPTGLPPCRGTVFEQAMRKNLFERPGVLEEKRV